MADEAPQSRRQCRACRHFRNDGKYLETAFAGMASLSSGYGSVRSADGICLRHDRYLSARSFCADFSPATADQVAAAHPAMLRRRKWIGKARRK